MDYLKPFPTSSEGYRIELARQSRLKDILKFCRENYHVEETLSKSLRAGAVDITEEELKLIEEDDDKVTGAVYESSPCLIAVHNETEEIVGVVLTVLSKRQEDDESASATLFGSITFKSTFGNVYYSHLAKMDKEASIFNKYPDANAALELYAIAVHKEHRQKGLAKDLSLIGVEIAKSIPEVGVVFGVYTSIYSKKVAEQVGMTSILEFDIERDFTDDDGDLVFRNTEPNNIVSVMALEVTRE